MSKKSILGIAGIILFSFLAIFILYAFSDKPFSYSQDFTRVLREGVVQQKHILDFKENDCYFAGSTVTQLFFGNLKDSLDLMVTDTALNMLNHVRLSVIEEKDLKLKGSHIEIKAPNFYIKAGGFPAIFKGNLGDWKGNRILKNAPFFEQGIFLGEKSFAFQTILTEAESGAHINAIGTISGNASEPHINTKILEGQADNYFTTMGTLRYSKKLNKLVYIYAYRNQYLVMDTSLHILLKGKTIDHSDQAMINPIEINDGTYSLASPPAVVNWTAQVYEDLLLIHSNLKASNESTEIFDKASVIDVYSLQTGSYRFSFYLPNYNNIKLVAFKVIGNRIIATHGQYVISYSIEWPINM